MYLLAIFLPPLAVLLSGKPFQAIINIFLTCLFFIPGILHAMLIVSERKNDKRTDRLIRGMTEKNNQYVG